MLKKYRIWRNVIMALNGLSFKRPFKGQDIGALQHIKETAAQTFLGAPRRHKSLEIMECAVATFLLKIDCPCPVLGRDRQPGFGGRCKATRGCGMIPRHRCSATVTAYEFGPEFNAVGVL